MDFRLPRGDIGADVVDRIYNGLLDHADDDADNEAEVLAEATPGQRAVYSLLAADGDVNNGGFAGFFTNPLGWLTDEAIAGAERVGLRSHAQILRAAADVFPGGTVPHDFDERTAVFEALPEEKAEDELAALDERWYATEDEFLPTIERYVRDHRDEFFRA